MRAIEFINEVTIDNSKGWGATPQNADVNYFGLRVAMKPSTFLKLARPLESNTENSDVEKHIASGGSIGSPFLDIQIPPEWEDGDFTKSARVRQHEGRNRMTAILKHEGDTPIEVHIFLRGGMRRRDITDGIITALNKGVINEIGTFLSGPLFGEAK